MRRLSLLLICYLNFCNAVVFDTPSGLVRGVQMQSRKGKHFNAFRGIPYAKPPVGDLRFRAPVAADKWTGVVNATEDANICLQKNILFFRHPELEGSEDCLYINIYTPLKHQYSKKTYPVMVYIHYGGFFVGSSKSTLAGPKFLMDQNIVLVTFNYRLGIFGFYSTVDDSAWGNWALKDQVLALRWVQAHIGSFGGNPKGVTIFGQSAGAGSVHFHILSPISRGLFHRAISESGSALSLWAKPFNQLQREIYKQVANAVGCDAEANTKTVVECMRNIDAKELIEILDTFKYFQEEPMNLFTTIIEEKTENNPEPFLTEDPVELIRKGNFNRVPWMLGVVDEEGILRASPLLRQSETAKEMNEKFDALLPQMLVLSSSLPEEQVAEAWKAIKDFYLNGTNKIDTNDPRSIQGFTNMYSDRAFIYGSYQSAMFHSLKDHRPIWFYKFSYKGKYTYGDVFAVTNETINANWGASHCDELIYLFDSTDLPFGELRGKDLFMSRLLVQMWTDFAKFMNPLEGWHPISAVENIGNFQLDYLHFPKDGIELELRNDFFTKRMQFWKNLPLHENIPEIA